MGVAATSRWVVIGLIVGLVAGFAGGFFYKGLDAQGVVGNQPLNTSEMPPLVINTVSGDDSGSVGNGFVTFANKEIFSYLKTTGNGDVGRGLEKMAGQKTSAKIPGSLIGKIISGFTDTAVAQTGGSNPRSCSAIEIGSALEKLKLGNGLFGYSMGEASECIKSLEWNGNVTITIWQRLGNDGKYYIWGYDLTFTGTMIYEYTDNHGEDPGCDDKTITRTLNKSTEFINGYRNSPWQPPGGWARGPEVLCRSTIPFHKKWINPDYDREKCCSDTKPIPTPVSDSAAN